MESVTSSDFCDFSLQWLGAAGYAHLLWWLGAAGYLCYWSGGVPTQLPIPHGCGGPPQLLCHRSRWGNPPQLPSRCRGVGGGIPQQLHSRRRQRGIPSSPPASVGEGRNLLELPCLRGIPQSSPVLGQRGIRRSSPAVTGQGLQFPATAGQGA